MTRIIAARRTWRDTAQDDGPLTHGDWHHRKIAIPLRSEPAPLQSADRARRAERSTPAACCPAIEPIPRPSHVPHIKGRVWLEKHEIFFHL